MKRDKFIRDFKIYNFVMNNIWQLLTTMLIGFGIGWLLEKYVDSPKNLYMIFSLIIAFAIGIANFFIILYKKLKKIQESEPKEQKNSDNVEPIEEEQNETE